MNFQSIEDVICWLRSERRFRITDANVAANALEAAVKRNAEHVREAAKYRRIEQAVHEIIEAFK